MDFATGEFADVTTTDSVFFSSLALAPDGTLFGVGLVVPPISPNAPRLWTIDRETGEVALGSTIGASGVPGDLTFDAAGNLWMTYDGVLFAVDPVTGAGTEIGGTDLVGLVDREGVLYSLRKSGADWDLVTVDKATGDATQVAPMPLLDDALISTVDMSLGNGGAVWVLALGGTPIPIPAEFPHYLYRFDNPATGEIEEVLHLEVTPIRAGLAVIRQEAIVAIPTVGSLGLMLLALALALAGWGVLRSKPA